MHKHLMRQQVMATKYVQKPYRSYRYPVQVGSEAKNSLSTNVQIIDSMDLFELSWIFVDGEKVKKTNDPQL